MFGIGSLSSYGSYEQSGEGTCNYIYRARDKITGDQVALKRLIFQKNRTEFPLSSVNEIKFLKSLSHTNIVNLKEIVTSKGFEHLDSNVSKKSRKLDEEPDAEVVGTEENRDKENKKEDTIIELDKNELSENMYLVFEHIDHNLGNLIDSKYKFSQRSIKCIAKQLFEVLHYLSEKKVIHRDIKTSNILLSNRHQLKLTGFGLVRSSLPSDGREDEVDLTNNVVTMMYKAPELLLGATRYTNAIDIWSAGCVLAELELGCPIFPGKTELEQFELICKVLGTPNEEIWVGLASLPFYDSFIKNSVIHPNVFRQSCDKKINEHALALLEQVFVLDPNRRPSPKVILASNYFFTHPLPPTNPSDLDPLPFTPGSSLHEYEMELKRIKQAAITDSVTAATASGAEVGTTLTAAAGSSDVPPPSIYCLPSTTVAPSASTAVVRRKYTPKPSPMGYSAGNLNRNSMAPSSYNSVSGYMPTSNSFAGGNMYAFGGAAKVNTSIHNPSALQHFSMPNSLQQPVSMPQWGYNPQQQQFQQPLMQPSSFQQYQPSLASSTTASAGYSPADAMYSQQALGVGMGAYSPNSFATSASGKGICDFFAKYGNCKKGDQCNFAHTTAPDGSTPDNKYMNSYSSGGESSSGVVCTYFSKFGNCTKGSQCRHRHISGEGAGPSSYSSSGGGGSGAGICYAFQKGECTRGSKCRFSHQEGAGGGGSGAGICYAFQKGECNRGSECRFTHQGGAGGGGGSGAGICYAFQKGECTRGSECRFTHQGGAGGASGGGGGGSGAGICYAFQKGECNRGSECRWSHQESAGGPGICYAFQKGECTRGSECRFTHQEGAGSASGGGSVGGSGAGICYAFQKGECNRGSECRWSHQLGAGSATGAGICYAFQKGECYRGNLCRYSHQEGPGGASVGGYANGDSTYMYNAQEGYGFNSGGVVGMKRDRDGYI